MNRLISAILLIVIGLHSVVFAEENWVFNNNETPQFSTVNKYPTIPISDEHSYRGSVATNINYNSYSELPNLNSSNVSTAQAKGSFSEEHPVITGLGVGALVLGAVAVGVLAAVADDDDDYYRRHHDEDRHHRYHRGHRHYHR